VDVDNLKPGEPLRREHPLRPAREHAPAEAAEPGEPEAIEGARFADAGLELNIARMQPFGLHAGDRKGRQVEAVLAAHQFDGGRVEHARAVVGAPVVIERETALPEREDTRSDAAAKRAVQAQCAVVEAVVSCAEIEAILPPGDATGIDVAAEAFDAPGAWLAGRVECIVRCIVGQCRQVSAIDEAVFVDWDFSACLGRLFSDDRIGRCELYRQELERDTDDTCSLRCAFPRHGAKRCSNGTDLSAHSRLPRTVMG
jgi:hypothetical protein